MSNMYMVLHKRLASGLQLLPDKPEETVDSTLRALWHMAAGCGGRRPPTPVC